MPQFVLLGASNLTISFPLILHSLTSVIKARGDIFAAHGHGRSYGTTSRVFCRELPGIRECHLWSDFESRHVTGNTPRALITDIGNDLLYGASPSTIAGWVETCLRRLTSYQADIVMTRLPMDSLNRLSAWRYRLTKLIFFPTLPTRTWDAMLQCANELDDSIQRLADEHHTRVIVPESSWYGFDPIHIRRTMRGRAWNRILAALCETAPDVTLQRPGVTTSLRYWRASPYARTVWGHKRTIRQPALQCEDRVSVWLY